MIREITTRVKRMNVEQTTRSYGLMIVSDFTTTLELEGLSLIHISEPTRRS